MQIWSLGQEDPLEEGMATHSGILPGEARGQRSLGVCGPWGHTESDTTEGTQHTAICHVLCLPLRIIESTRISLHAQRPQRRAGMITRPQKAAVQTDRAKSLQSCPTETLWTLAPQVSLSTGFSRREYRSGLPCPPPGDLLDSRTELMCLMSVARAGRLFTASAAWEALKLNRQTTGPHGLLWERRGEDAWSLRIHGGERPQKTSLWNANFPKFTFFHFLKSPPPRQALLCSQDKEYYYLFFYFTTIG